MPTKKDFSKIASTLVGGTPLDFSLKADGSLVVIAPNGQKVRFTSEQVEAVLPKPKSSPKPKPKPQPKRGRTTKATSLSEPSKSASKG